MTMLPRVALSGAFALAFGTAASAQSPQIPNLANTNPVNPVATDGSPLPHSNTGYPVVTGRSAFVGPVGGAVGAVGGDLVGAGLGVAGGAVDTGLNATGVAVDAAGQPLR